LWRFVYGIKRRQTVKIYAMSELVQIGMKRIHHPGDTDHFTDELTLLQMTRQMTAYEIVCGRETKWNEWTPGDDYIHPGDVQDDV
jgi:hypothetical protein